MFLKTAGFKKLIKEAYKGAGLRIGHTQDGLYLAGSYWAMQIMGGNSQKKSLLPSLN